MTFNKFIQDYQPGYTCEVQDHVLTKWVFYGLEDFIWSSNYTWKIQTYRKSYIKVSNKCYTDLKWMSANYLFPNIISEKQCFSIWKIERWPGGRGDVTKKLKFRTLSERDIKPWQFTVRLTLTAFILKIYWCLLCS